MIRHSLRLPGFAGIVLLLACVAGARAASAETQTVEAVGEAAIVKDDRGAAVERATEDALRRAVEQACGTLVQTSSETKDFQLISDRILTQARGYVKSYEELDRRVDGGAMVVKVRATVGTEQLADDLVAIGLALSRKGMPRVAVLIAEQQIGQASPAAWWGTAAGGQAVQGQQGLGQQGGQGAGPVVTIDQRLAENTFMSAWQKAGFSFVDLQALSGKIQLSGLVSTNPNGQQVREIANLSDADVIIVGTAVATKAGDLAAYMNTANGAPPMVSCKGVVSARAFNADNGEILAASETSKSALNIETFACGRIALTKATEELASDLQKKVLTKWNAELGGSLRVRMKVSGIDSFGTLAAFRSALTSGVVRGVQSVDQKSFKDGVADLDVRVKGSSEELAGEIEAKQPGKVKARVVSLTANTIEVNLGR